jgi:NADPH2:quinone reductase
MARSQEFAAAAAVPTAGLTAWQALFDQGGLKVGQTLLLHGGSGGVGSYAIPFAKAAGIRVAATCSTPNVGYVKSLGADRVIDYRSEDVPSATRAWSPGGVDVVIDAVSHGTLPTAFEMLRPGGTLVSIATINGDGDIAGDTAAAQQRGLTKKYALMNPALAHQQFAAMAPLFDAGQVPTPALEVLPWEQVVRAHELVATGHVRGKIVLEVTEQS